MNRTIAVIGCGAIADLFYFPAFSRLTRPVELILIDSDAGRAKRAADQFEGAKSATEYREILNAVDGAIIATPHHLHYAIAKDFLEKGIPVLCEKPLAETADDAKALVEISARHRAALCVNNTRRLAPASEAIKKLLQDGAIGDLRSIRYIDGSEFKWPTSSGFYFDPKISPKGVLLDIGAHVLDLICWWLGAKPKLVSSHNDSLGGCEAVAAVTFQQDACSGEVRLSRLAKLSNRYRIEGERGYIEGGVYDWSKLDLIGDARTGKVSQLHFKDGEPKAFAVRLLENFMDVIDGSATPLIPAAEVISSLELLDEAYEKAGRFPMPWYEQDGLRATP